MTKESEIFSDLSISQGTPRTAGKPEAKHNKQNLTRNALHKTCTTHLKVKVESITFLDKNITEKFCDLV